MVRVPWKLGNSTLPYAGVLLGEGRWEYTRVYLSITLSIFAKNTNLSSLGIKIMFQQVGGGAEVKQTHLILDEI